MNTSLLIDNKRITARVAGLLLTTLVVLALAGLLHFGVSRSLASSGPPGPFPSPETGVSTEQSVPMQAASAGDDLGPGNAEPLLVGSF